MNRLNTKNNIVLIVGLVAITWCISSSFAQAPVMNNPTSRYEPVYGNLIPVCNCEDLTKVTMPNTTIESAIVDAKSSSCQVVAIVNHPPSNDRVKVWINLPLNTWNGRFYGTGGSGFLGGHIMNLSLPVAQGFATGATDTGHEGRSGAFALDTINRRLNWQLIRDNGYQGIHDMTVIGKTLVQAFYGKPAHYSYFVGASTGGRQGLIEAQRFPEDYDGIVSLCPGIHKSLYTIAWLWPQAVMNDSKNYLSKEKLDAVTKAVILECDGDDGVLDGVIGDPINCKWDPQKFVGTAVGESTFSAADADVVRKIWEGPRTKDGNFIWYGLLRGTNLSVLAGTTGTPLKGIPQLGALEWCRYLLLSDPKWDGTSVTTSEFELLWNQSLDQYSKIYNPDNPDLTLFREHGSKIIIWQGLADELVFPQGTIKYFEEMQRRMGGLESTSKFARLFLVPGVDHGFHGAGPEPVGEVEAIISWVEKGMAPERLSSELKDSTGKIIRTRPLFPYPKMARYTGSGSMDEAENFESFLPSR